MERALPDLIAFADADAMAARVAHLIALALARGIAATGAGILAVSGGSTPQRLHARLSAMELDWSRVTIFPVDERWVDADHPASNEGFIRRTLMIGPAAAARFISLKSDHPTPADGLAHVAARLSPGAIDAVVFGMGTDGHAASWFPNAAGLGAAIDPEGRARVAAIRANQSAVTGDLVDRMTLTLSYCLRSPVKVLLIEGDVKRAAFVAARAGGPVEASPVRALLAHAPDLWACWAP